MAFRNDQDYIWKVPIGVALLYESTSCGTLTANKGFSAEWGYLEGLILLFFSIGSDESSVVEQWWWDPVLL